MSFKQMENHSQLLCGRDSENERHLLCQFDLLELITIKIKQNYLEQRDLAPLTHPSIPRTRRLLAG